MEDSEEPLPDIAVTRRSPCGRRHLGTRSQCYSGEEEQFYSAALAQTRYPMPLYSTLEHVRNYKLPVPAYWVSPLFWLEIVLIYYLFCNLTIPHCLYTSPHVTSLLLPINGRHCPLC